MKNKLVVVTGPTASGKSDLAMQIALAFGGELVSADSVQVYREFDIGSAKPSREDLALVRHHFISTLDPTEDFSAGQFSKAAREVITDIWSRGKLAVVVGGTGFYISALLHGLPEVGDDNPADQKAFWDELESLRSQSSSDENYHEELVSWLEKVDPKRAKEVGSTNRARIIRALRAWKLTGKKTSDFTPFSDDFPAETLVLLVGTEEREKLYSRINERAEIMFREGFIEEVRKLRSRYPHHCKGFLAIGYREIADYLDGELTESRLVHLVATATRQFAKRQITWWRHQPSERGWEELKAEISSLDEIKKLISGLLSQSYHKPRVQVVRLPISDIYLSK